MNKVIDNRFSESLDIAQIRAKITVRPEPVVALDSFDAAIASEQLTSILKQIFIPNDFSLTFIREMVGRASVHSRYLFATETEYASRIFNPPEVEVFPFCLTGLSGVGKSQTIAALRKVLPQPTEFTCDLYEGFVTLVSHWYASGRHKTNGKSLLVDFLFGVNKPPGRFTVAQLRQECRRRAYRDGVALLMLDETQHITTGPGASMVTEILLTMAGIGMPMIYVSNYSLGHKLFRRNSEDKQRLLANPRIMLPDEPESADWHNYVAECLRVSNGYIKADVGELGAELYRCTFGIKRLAVQLLALAYVECRDAGRQSANLLDLTRAYRSAAYTVGAVEVETLQSLELSSRKTKKHLDLQCPFDLPIAMKSNVVKFTSDNRHDQVIAKVFKSSLTEGERSAMKDMEAVNVDAHQGAKPRPRAPVTKLNAEEQGNAFFEYMNTVVPAKPKKPK